VSDRPCVATTSLAGCFGCHMSFLDIDERIVELAEAIHLDRTPLTDVKQLHHCRIGLIEGGVGSEENLQVLQEFRARCEIVVAVGACSGLPSSCGGHLEAVAGSSRRPGAGHSIRAAPL